MKFHRHLPFGAIWWGSSSHDHRSVWIGIYLKRIGEIEWHFMR